MASLLKDKNRLTGKFNGCRTIQFVSRDGVRKCIRLGKISHRNAEAIKVKVEAIVAAAFSQHSWDNETSLWVGKLAPKLYDKLAKVDLLPRRKDAMQETLAAFLDSFIASQDVKKSTRVVYGHTRRCLVKYFGADKTLSEISPGDADDWRKWLKSNQNLSPNTIRRRCGIARQFFKYGVRKRLLAENPFAEIEGGVSVRANRERDFFVTAEMAASVLEACPDAQWRLLFALSRYGGLRCPSEHLALTWGDVDWEKSRLTIRSPKTAHHEGKAYRVIPIFPELRPYLVEGFELAEPGTEYVITRYRDTNMNLRTQLIRIIEKAGLVPWPKLFQNLRATRATELEKEFGGKAAAEWVGHSITIADKHYWQVTEADFERGANQPTVAVQKAQQKAQQQMSATVSTHRQESKEPAENTAIYDGLLCCTGVQVGDEGLEPPTSTL